jgi:hypothetical protein
MLSDKAFAKSVNGTVDAIAETADENDRTSVEKLKAFANEVSLVE